MIQFGIKPHVSLLLFLKVASVRANEEVSLTFDCLFVSLFDPRIYDLLCTVRLKQSA